MKHVALVLLAAASGCSSSANLPRPADKNFRDYLAFPPRNLPYRDAPKDAKQTADGVRYVMLRNAKGERVVAKRGDTVDIFYAVRLTDGELVTHTTPPEEPTQFVVDEIHVPGLKSAIQQLAQGEGARLWIPKKLGYAMEPKGALIVDVLVKRVIPKPEPPKPPENVDAPPTDAKVTPSGVYYKVLRAGTGKVSPKATNRVTVHYTGWTTDGKMFDSSVTKGTPATFPLGGVIPGWRDGLQTMVVGDRTRFWIPEALAYKGQPGRPQGMLVFDVELLDIK